LSVPAQKAAGPRPDDLLSLLGLAWNVRLSTREAMARARREL
jgi:hypothetical protein